MKVFSPLENLSYEAICLSRDYVDNEACNLYHKKHDKNDFDPH